jgi:LysR family transcriptional regulator, nitrogen assimilation regulatory protein
MNSDDLGFFALVVDAGSISAAGILFGCDASTVSRRITQLEKSCGTRLFERSGRGVELSPQGRVLLDFARQMGSLMDAAQVAMNGSKRQGPARIHIAAQPTIAKVLFSALFHAIRARYPAVEIHFTEALANKILLELQSGEIDIAILYKPEYPGSLPYEALLYERLYLIVPAGSEVTAEQVLVTGLAGIPLVLPSTAHGLRVLVQAMAARQGWVPNIVLQSDSSSATTLDLVSKGCGSTLKPLVAAQADIAAGRLRGFPLQGPDAERCIALVVGKTRIASADLWVLNQLVREIATGLVRSGQWCGARLAEPGEPGLPAASPVAAAGSP